MRFRSLRSRIAFFSILLLVIVQGIAFFVLDAANSKIARDTLNQELDVGERIFQRVLEQNRAQLEQGATLLSADYAFRSAIGTNDTGTIDSVLKNHGTRLSASTMMLIGINRTLTADTLHPGSLGKPFQFAALIDRADATGKASAIVSMDKNLYQLVVVPVLAPDLIAYVAMGFRIDDKMAKDLKALTSLDVAFASKTGSGPWAVHAATLPVEMQQALPGHLPSAVQQPGQHLSFGLAGDDYQARITALGQQGDTTMVAVLQRSFQEAFAPFQRLRVVFFWLALGIVIASIIGSMAIARNISRPLHLLAQFAKQIQQGDYTQTVAVKQDDEIGALAGSFNHMLEGITARENEILRLAYEDTLTGLPNRAMFNDRLSQVIKLAKRSGTAISVLTLDLDRFKYVNDTLGHHAGDEVLREVGARLRTVLRDSDTVARLGGDEFAILTPTGDAEKVAIIARKILRALETPISVEGEAVDVGTSIGIARYPEHGDNAGTLMRHADVAMYGAKRNQAGYTVYDASLDAHRQDYLSLLSQLRRAVEHDELRLFYQPKIDITTSRVVAVEALLRWQHPERGLVAPIEFIPFAEQTGYIQQLTHWVIRKALLDMGAWAAREISLRLSLNVSTRDLIDNALPDMVAQSLTQHRVAAERLCLEITESALMEDPQRAHETLKRLHGLGVRISIDDYGTGYSSLAYIKKLAVDELKIDRSFIHGVAHDEQNLAIVRSTVELGHNLGLSVVAEGVETEQELKLLLQFGCDEAQGYFFAKPMQREQLQDWLIESTWGLENNCGAFAARS